MARDKAPTGPEIKEKAKSAELDSSKAGVGQKGGKTAKLVPAKLHHLKDVKELEDGQFIGVLETEIEGDRAGLPPGTYDVFVAKVKGDWNVYFESGGQVVGQAASVVEKKEPPPGEKPQFSEGSFCWWVWLIFTGFQWCV
jgi:hypothetical protein